MVNPDPNPRLLDESWSDLNKFLWEKLNNQSFKKDKLNTDFFYKKLLYFFSGSSKYKISTFPFF